MTLRRQGRLRLKQGGMLSRKRPLEGDLMPNPDRLLATLRQAVGAFRATPGRKGRLVNLPVATEVLVGGDLHGNVENFRLLLKVADLANHPTRHLVLQELIHGAFHYPDGSDKSHQLLDLTAALRCQFPERVHFLLGNHELAQWQGQRIGKGDRDYNEAFRAGVDKAYGASAERIYAAYVDFFAVAELALRTPNRILVSHSLPSTKRLDAFDVSVLERDELAPADVKLGGSVHALVWGRDTSQANVEAFLRKMDADLLITGHIPCDQGYAVPNDRQIILDAQAYPACYCLFPTDRPLTQKELIECVGTL
jgi:hypothetical protein